MRFIYSSIEHADEDGRRVTFRQCVSGAPPKHFLNVTGHKTIKVTVNGSAQGQAEGHFHYASETVEDAFEMYEDQWRKAEPNIQRDIRRKVSPNQGIVVAGAVPPPPNIIRN